MKEKILYLIIGAIVGAVLGFTIDYEVNKSFDLEEAKKEEIKSNEEIEQTEEEFYKEVSGTYSSEAKYTYDIYTFVLNEDGTCKFLDKENECKYYKISNDYIGFDLKYYKLLVNGGSIGSPLATQSQCENGGKEYNKNFNLNAKIICEEEWKTENTLHYNENHELIYENTNIQKK